MRRYAALPLGLGLLAIPALAADQKNPRGGGHPQIAAPKAPALRPAATAGAGRQGQGRAGNPIYRPNAERIERVLKMSPEEREQFLSSLPPVRRQNVEKQLQDYAKMAPARRNLLMSQVEMLHSLPPQKQAQVTRAIRQFQALPEDRKAVIKREMGQLAPMSDEERRARMNSEEFRNRYSATEQQMMSNLSQVTPQPQ